MSAAHPERPDHCFYSEAPHVWFDKVGRVMHCDGCGDIEPIGEQGLDVYMEAYAKGARGMRACGSVSRCRGLKGPMTNTPQLRLPTSKALAFFALSEMARFTCRCTRGPDTFWAGHARKDRSQESLATSVKADFQATYNKRYVSIQGLTPRGRAFVT
jgi:hypothetical protein